MYIIWNTVQSIRMKRVNVHEQKQKQKTHCKSKEEGKDQESIQSSTTPDPGHHMGKRHKHEKTSHTRDPRDQPLPSNGLP